MEPNLSIDTEDLKLLFIHTKGAYPNTTFFTWCNECKESYISYFENKKLFNVRKYTYSQFVNAQILAIS